MKTPGQQLRKLRGLSHTWRWNYHPRVRQESVAEHSYWVAVIVYQLLKMKSTASEFQSKCLVYALLHDMEECITGDLPAPVKRGRSWDDVEKAALSEIYGAKIGNIEIRSDVKRIVKMADTLSALLFADEEVKMGNSMFIQIRAELLYVADDYEDEHVSELLHQMGFGSIARSQPIKEMSHL